MNGHPNREPIHKYPHLDSVDVSLSLVDSSKRPFDHFVLQILIIFRKLRFHRSTSHNTHPLNSAPKGPKGPISRVPERRMRREGILISGPQCEPTCQAEARLAHPSNTYCDTVFRPQNILQIRVKEHDGFENCTFAHHASKG